MLNLSAGLDEQLERTALSSSPKSSRVSIMHGPLYGLVPVPNASTCVHDPEGVVSRKWSRLFPDAQT